MATTRSNRPEVRNPLLRMQAMARAAEMFAELPAEVQQAWLDLFAEVSEQARETAEHTWRRHKAPMAVYWRWVAVYVRHFSVALRAHLRERKSHQEPRAQ